MKKLHIKTPEYNRLEISFREWLELLGYSGQTVYTLPHHLREFFYWLEEKDITNIKDVQGTQAKQFIDGVSCRANQRREGGLSQNHLNKYIQSLKLFSKYIRVTGQGYFTIAMSMTKGERPYLDGQKDILTLQEIRALYKACDYTPYTPLALRDKAMLSIFYGCGLRRNEGVMLNTDDILLEKRVIYVRKGKHYTERYVPMSDKVIQDVTNYIYDARPCIVQSLPRTRFGENRNFFLHQRTEGSQDAGAEPGDPVKAPV
jgi:integrase/recombinase XerD